MLKSRLCKPKLSIAWSIADDSNVGRFGEIEISFDDVDGDDDEVDVLLFEYEVDGRLLDSSVSLGPPFANMSSIEGGCRSPNVLMAVAIARDSTNSSSEFLMRLRVESRSLKVKF